MFKKDLDLEKRWSTLLKGLHELIGKKPADLNGVLFIIGVQELGQGMKNFSKEQKQDLMHIAICKVLSLSGFYELDFIDQDGWPHWKLVKELPHFDMLEQEKLLKIQVLEYFEKEFEIDIK
ncbi:MULTISPECIES: hypothetical protein [Echinicola]|uniref:Uncharacterized protein n=2 Tax=Echinicola TaxID=390846 RepID=A0A2Z4IHY3_9BACT|nr:MULTISPECIES: hypothetical protein [Echinicola]AWW30741.1 hypothetical protein DN752_11740 [Echinicola strongylocentroti]GGF28103.1 hypothetical protein GCM10011339_15290 [Echinicola rosea]